MGTWDSGITDNDAACDGLGELVHSIVADIEKLALKPPTAASTAELCAATGVLIQLHDYSLRPESSSGSRVVAAIEHHARLVATCPPSVREILDAVKNGKHEELAGCDRPGTATDELLAAGTSKARFGVRHDSLFELPGAATYVQSVADRCVEALDEDYEIQANWSDLCRESIAMGHLAALTTIAPCNVPTANIQEWRRRTRRGLVELREREDEELEFHEAYYANLDGVFAFLLARFGER